MSTIGERLRMIRGGRSRKEFSQLYDIHWNSIKRYEDGERKNIPKDYLERVISGENINPNWLFTGEGPMYIEGELHFETKAPEKQPAQDDLITALREQIDALKQNAELAKMAADALRRENDSLREQSKVMQEQNATLREHNETLKKQVKILEEQMETERRRARKAAMNDVSVAG